LELYGERLLIMALMRIEKFIIKKAGSLDDFEKLPFSEKQKILRAYEKKYKVIS
jgi:hypothetical protein